MPDDSPDNGADTDDKIAYHKEMEEMAMRAGDFTKAGHHRNMQNIFMAMKEQQHPHKTPEQISDEDYKIAPTSADAARLSATNNRSFPEWRSLYDVSDSQIEKLPWFTRNIDPDLKHELERRKIKAGKFLDLGTGPATQAIQLSKLGFDVTATDVSASAIARGRKLSNAVRFEVDDILESKLKDNQFDYIFDRGCFHVFEPPNRSRYVSKVHSLLTGEGLLFLKTFSIKEPMTSGPYRFSAEMIRELFQKDFEILSSKDVVFQGTLPVLPKALFTVMRRKIPSAKH